MAEKQKSFSAFLRVSVPLASAARVVNESVPDMMKILIIGGTGLISTALTRKLLARETEGLDV